MYNGKLVVSGKQAELYVYEKAIVVEKNRRFFERSRVSRSLSEEEQAESRKVSQYRSKRNLRRLVSSNSYEWFNSGRVYTPMFLTLTFKENITDVEVANRAFSRFVQRMNYKIFKPKGVKMAYVCVVEFQKRGAVHYHMIVFNMPFIENSVYSLIRSIWRKNNSDGAIFLEPVKSVDGAVKYITKYLCKNFDADWLKGKKRFFCSRNLLRPIIVRDDDIVIGEFVDAIKANLQWSFIIGSFPVTGKIGYWKFKIPDYVNVFV